VQIKFISQEFTSQSMASQSASHMPLLT